MTPQQASDDHPTGDVRTIGGKYRIVCVRGKGGMGVVYEAVNTWTGRKVAVKVLDPDKTPSPDKVRRFMQEARAAAQLNHPNIVDVLDMGQDPVDGSHFIVQELLEGGDVRGRLETEVYLPHRDALTITAGVLRALVVAHERGIIHRDIKPANIMLTRGADGGLVPKLIDFGISKVTTEDTSLVETSTGQILGTPAYMSPEQLRAERPVDAQTDVWAVGVVLYEMLTGELPFDGQNYNVLVFKVLSEQPIPVTRWQVNEISPELVEVVHRALATQRTDRYPSAQAFLDDVIACLDDARPSTETAISSMPRGRTFALPTHPPPKVSTTAPAIPIGLVASAAELAATDPAIAHRRHWPRTRVTLAVVGSAMLAAIVVAASIHYASPRPAARIVPEAPSATIVSHSAPMLDAHATPPTTPVNPTAAVPAPPGRAVAVPGHPVGPISTHVVPDTAADPARRFRVRRVNHTAETEVGTTASPARPATSPPPPVHSTTMDPISTYPGGH